MMTASETRSKLVPIMVYLPKKYIERLDNMVRRGIFPSRNELIHTAVKNLLLDPGRNDEMILIKVRRGVGIDGYAKNQGYCGHCRVVFEPVRPVNAILIRCPFCGGQLRRKPRRADKKPELPRVQVPIDIMEELGMEVTA
jgi:antitoxin ParD1/3/4